MKRDNQTFKYKAQKLTSQERQRWQDLMLDPKFQKKFAITRWGNLAGYTPLLDLPRINRKPPTIKYWINSKDPEVNDEIKKKLANIEEKFHKKDAFFNELKITKDELAYIYVNAYLDPYVSRMNKVPKIISRFNKKSYRNQFIKRLKPFIAILFDLFEALDWLKYRRVSDSSPAHEKKVAEAYEYIGKLAFDNQLIQYLGVVFKDLERNDVAPLDGGKRKSHDERNFIVNLANVLKDRVKDMSITKCKNSISVITEVVYLAPKKPENIAKWLKQETSLFKKSDQ